MKLNTLLSSAALMVGLVLIPGSALAATNVFLPDVFEAMSVIGADTVVPSEDGTYQLARRGRGRGGDDDRSDDDDDDDRSGRGGDDRHSDDDDDDRSGRDRDRSDRDRDRDRSGGSGRRARVPGGSGCDDPGDILEHSECSGGAAVMPGDSDAVSGSGRDRPRIPGGSGCDDPGDLIEHPECRP